MDHTGRVVAVYWVGVGPNRVRRFPYQYATEWEEETFAYYAAAGMNKVSGVRPSVPRRGRPPPLPPAKELPGAPQSAVGQGVARGEVRDDA